MKDIFGASKDLIGIRKDLVETKLAQFEVERYERLNEPSILNDIKEYTSRVIKRLLSSSLIAGFLVLGRSWWAAHPISFQMGGHRAYGVVWLLLGRCRCYLLMGRDQWTPA